MSSQVTLNSQVRFADYFVICGLDLSTGLELNVISGESQQLRSPIERSYKCKVLAHFPENVAWNLFDKHAACMLSLPHGLKFRTQKQSLEPEFHSFIITKEDGSRCYGFSLVFFEEVADRKLCSAMQTLQAMHLTELSSSRHSGRMRVLNNDSTRSLPRHFKLSTPLSKAAQSYYDSAKDTLFASKSINLICQLPFVHAANKFLSGLYQYSLSGGDLSLDSYVYNVIHQVPLPLPGRCLNFNCFDELILLQRPGNIAELPFFDFSLRAFFELLGIDVAIQLFTCLLLEHQVLLYSSVYQRLMLVAECSTILMFPFSWPHVYVPILPASLHHFLDAPVPFVMGLHQTPNAAPYTTADNQAICHVDIDNKRIQLPEELPPFPQRSDFIDELLEVMQRYGVEPDKFRPAGDRRSLGLRRKLSWSQESENGLVCVENAFMSSSISGFLPSPVTGVMGMSRSDSESNSLMVLDCQGSPQEQYAAELRFNNAVREVFLNRFVHIFSAYEHFVIHPNQDMEQWLSFRESMQNFDKATFLSDQPEQQLPFLSRFIETQMFATLIDQKILSAWQPVEPSLRVFDKRIKLIRTRFGDSLVRTPGYEPCTTITDSELLLEKRLSGADTMAPAPTEICANSAERELCGTFPTMNREALNKEPPHRSRRRSSGQWRERSLHSAETTPTSEVAPPFTEQQHQPLLTNKNMKQPKMTDMSPAVIAQTNWNFVEKLLKDCKVKTKRMLVEKMGSEAVELGHAEPSIIGVEENTLVASLCDLLERVWSHGLHKKMGKSALWSHLLNFQELEESSDTSKPISPNFLTPDLSSMALESEESFSGGSRSGRSSARSSRSNSRRQSPERRDRSVHEATLRPLPVSVTFDMRNVLAMTDIKTHIGYARAWVRLALEKKLLSKHLRTLLMDTSLLKTLYKRYAFLRCDDEKEQFLYHLLTLNAVDYYCYTNTYTSTKLPYRIVIFPSRKSPLTTANLWVSVTGTLGETSQISVPHGFLEFVFHHKNLGLLTSMRVGHDNYGASAKFLIEHVVARNEVTGHTFKFPCGKWLGRGMDDGSIERLLVGEMVPRHVDSDELIESCMTPPRCRSPSIPRRSVDPKISTPDLQQMLGETVNCIVKHFLRPRRSHDKGGLTQLLCGEGGLVPCLEQTFMLGFKFSRLFGRNLYLWDFFARVRDQFEISLVDESNSSCLEEEQEAASAVMRLYCRLVEGIETQGENLGKEGKLQLLICLAARDHLLHRMIPHIAATRACAEMFEENSFLRDASLCTFLYQILESLDEFDFVLENSLTKGLQL